MAFQNNKVVQEIEFREIESDDFDIIEVLLKTGKVTISGDNALRLVRLSFFFEMKFLREFVTRILEEDEEIVSAIELFLFAFEIGSKPLIDLSEIRMAQMKETIFFSESLEKYVSRDAFLRILSNDI